MLSPPENRAGFQVESEGKLIYSWSLYIQYSRAMRRSIWLLRRGGGPGHVVCVVAFVDLSRVGGGLSRLCGFLALFSFLYGFGPDFPYKQGRLYSIYLNCGYRPP